MEYESYVKDHSTTSLQHDYLDVVKDHIKALYALDQEKDPGANAIWDPNSSPIILDFLPAEYSPVHDLIGRDDEVFSKFMTVICSLYDEMQLLQREASDSFWTPLIMYGEHKGDIEEGDEELMFGRFLPFLQRLCTYLDRVDDTVQCTIQNLISISSASTQDDVTINSKHLHLYVRTLLVLAFIILYKALGGLLGTLVCMDEIIARNGLLKAHCSLYSRMLHKVKTKADVLQFDQDKADSVDKMIAVLKTRVIEGKMFNNCVGRNLTTNKTTPLAHNKPFMEEFIVNIKTMIGYIDTKIGQATQADTMQQMIGLVALYLIYTNLIGSPHKSTLKSIWALQKK
eukprot:Ihof_evm1s8 gene=Ihof_evmTU1s8